MARARTDKTLAVDFRLKLIRSSRVPIYRQIHDQIVEVVARGDAEPGQRLPPVRTLAKALGVNPMTVAKAYQDLAASGLTSAHSGAGTRIADARGNGVRHKGALSDTAAAVSIAQRLFELARAPGVIAFTGNYARPEDSDVDGFRTCIAELAASGEVGTYFRYDPPAGRPELQQQIARFVAEQGIMAAPDDIVITSGGQQGIDLATRVLVSKGTTVICERPAYFGVLNALRAAQVQILEVPVEADGMDIHALEKLLRRHRPQAIYTNPTFQNPSGATMSLAKRKALLALARRHRVAIVEDDHCPELRFRGESLPSLKSLAERDDAVFYVRGFGKTVVPGIRLGFLVVSPGYRLPTLSMKALTDLQSNSFMQGVLARYLASGKHQAAGRQMRKTFARRQALLLQALAEALPDEVMFNEPDGGLSLWLTLPAGVTTPELYFKAVRHGVTFVAGDVFHATAPERATLRLSFGLIKPESIAEGAKRVGDLAHDLLERAGPSAVFL